MKKQIVHLLQSGLYHFFLMLMPLAAILDMIYKMNFTNFSDKIRHSITVMQFAYIISRAGKEQGQW